MSDLNVDLKIRATIEGVDDIQSVEEALRGVGDAAAPAADAQGEAAASARALGDEAGNAAIGLDDMRAALAAVASVAILRDLVDTAAAFEAMEKGLEALSGSSESARAEMAYVAQTADRLGVGVRDAAQSYVSLSAATKGTALEGQNTRAIFESVAGAMSKLGKSGAETQQALAAIGQMASKGTVSMEELRGQLGEALPGAMQAAARAMGVTVAELDAMVSSGRVAADDLLPKLAAELTKTFGTEPPDTINSALARLQNKLDLAYKTFGETGSMEAFKTALSGVGTALEAVAITASGAWEAVELAGNGLGALAAALAQAASGDVAGAWESLKTNIAEAADQAASDIVHVADAVTGAGEAVAATASVFQAPTLAAERLAASLGTVGQEGGASADAIAKLFKQLDLTTPDGVTALVDAFTLLGEGTRDADKALTDYTATMSAADLSAFRAQIEAVYQGGQVDAARFAQVNDQILAASFQRLGLTAETALGRISPAAGEAIASLDGIRSAVANTADSGAAKMQALEQAVGAALGKADTLAAVEALRGRIEAMGQAGELSAAGMQRLNDQMGDQARKIEQSIPGIQSMAEAYKQLGITAMSEMQKAADANLAAFEALKAGKAPLADLQAGFMAYAASAIRANSGVADSALLAQAGVLGLRDEVVRIEADAIQSSEAMHRVEASYKASADAAQRQAQAIQQSAAANVAATKAALEAAKARGDEVEIARAAIQLAQAEAQAARDVAAAKQIEADAAWMKVEAVKVELMQDGLLTEADMQVVEASKQVAEGKQAEADAALDAAAAKGADANAAEKNAGEVKKAAEASTASMQGFTISAETMAAKYGVATDKVAAFGGKVSEIMNSRNVFKGISSYEQYLSVWNNVYTAAAAYANKLSMIDDITRKVALSNDDAGASLTRLAAEGKTALSHMRDLSDEDLAPLRAAIKDAENRLKDMGDAAHDTLGDLRDEFDEMNGDLDAIEKRRADQRRADIETKRQEAVAAGNAQAVRDYDESLRLLDQVSKARIKNAAEREMENATKASAPAKSSPPAKTVNVRITLPGGSTKTVTTTAGSEDALLDALETLGARA